MRTLSRALLPAAAMAAVFAALPRTAAQPSKTAGADPAKFKAVLDKAAAYLKTAQDDNGGWSTKRSPGVTGVVVTGLLTCGVSPDDEPAAKGLKYVESLINPKAGHIAGENPQLGLQNYVTSVNVMALAAARRDAKYKPVIGNAAEFLKKLQWDDGEGKKPEDDFYGGAGYDSKSRPDLSNTGFFLEALKSAGVPPDDPAMKKAMIFVSRCQNFESEFNKMPWAGRINDGSFIYSAAAGGQTRARDEPDAPLVGYGSMTYAGIKSMIYCGVGTDDPRMKKAIEWAKKNYTLDANPGMAPQFPHRGLYYYYHTFAKAMHAMGQDTFVDAGGTAHDWRAELLEALAKRQKPDGSWVNDNDRWMEGDPNLVTGYALMALAYCKK